MDLDITTKEQALKAIHDLREAATKRDADLTEVQRRLSGLDEAVQKIYERGPETIPDATEREIVARYTETDGKPILCGFLDAGEDGGGDWVPGYLDDKPVNRLQADIQKAVDDRKVVRSILSGIALHKGRRPETIRTPKADARVMRLLRGLPKALRDSAEKAWADVSNLGGEFIPDDLLPTFERDIGQTWDRSVPGLFQTIDASTPISWGTLTAGWQAYLQGDVGGDDPAQIRTSSGATSSATVDFKNLAVRTQVSEDATEDSILPVMDQIIRPGLVFAVVSAVEDAMVNADTTASHADTGIATWNPDSFWPAAPGGLSIDHRRAWIGLRHRAGDLSTGVDRSTFTIATLMLDVANLAGPMSRPSDTVGIFSKLGFAKNIWGDSTSTLTVGIRTIDQYAGQVSDLVPGEIARVGGTPIVLSQFMTADLNASGIYDGSTTSYTGALVLKRNRFVVVRRRGLRVEVDKDITRGIFNLVASSRLNFAPRLGASSTEANVRYLYKMAKS